MGELSEAYTPKAVFEVAVAGLGAPDLLERVAEGLAETNGVRADLARLAALERALEQARETADIGGDPVTAGLILTLLALELDELEPGRRVSDQAFDALGVPAETELDISVDYEAETFSVDVRLRGRGVSSHHALPRLSDDRAHAIGHRLGDALARVVPGPPVPCWACADIAREALRGGDRRRDRARARRAAGSQTTSAWVRREALERTA